MRNFRILEGDALAMLRTLPESNFDACLCDPPYGLSFMGKQWDHGIPSSEAWAAVLRVLKPGAHLMSFGGSRTHHRLMCAIEDAGFEIRDCLMWLYGTGFPKSLDISKAIDKAAGAEHVIGTPSTEAAKLWDGYGTALKPAWEPIILAMKPCDGTFARNAQKWGLAGLAIEAGRIDLVGIENHRTAPTNQIGGNGIYGTANGIRTEKDLVRYDSSGRWPANVLLDETSATMLDQQSGELASGFMAAGTPRNNRMGYNGALPPNTAAADTYGDSGGASRFFYIAKADSAERHAAGKNTHPTVKPVDLTAYLAKLLLPPAGSTRRILVPFSGSGSEIMGALRAGWDEAVGIELSSEYAAMARRRIAHDAPLLNVEASA